MNDLSTYFIVRSQVLETGSMEDYVRTDDLAGALACAERLVARGECVATEVREDGGRGRLLGRFVIKPAAPAAPQHRIGITQEEFEAAFDLEEEPEEPEDEDGDTDETRE